MARIRAAVSNHPLATVAVAVTVVALAAFVLYWFEPQALLIDERVDEDLPAISAGAGEEMSGDGQSASADQTAEAKKQEPRATATVVARGELRGLDHAATGNALLVRLADGSHVLRFEDLMTENGPDLRVYLSAAPATGDAASFNDDYVELGHLKGNIGDQNYGVPADVDLSKYRTPVIWCKRFEVGFAVAGLG